MGPPAQDAKPPSIAARRRAALLLDIRVLAWIRVVMCTALALPVLTTQLLTTSSAGAQPFWNLRPYFSEGTFHGYLHTCPPSFQLRDAAPQSQLTCITRSALPAVESKWDHFMQQEISQCRLWAWRGGPWNWGFKVQLCEGRGRWREHSGMY